MNADAEQILKEKEIKITANRILVLNTFLKNSQALSVNNIEELLPWADNVTIFRTLKTFEENALVHTIKDESRAVKYALCSLTCEVNHHSVHPHFHCDMCGNTICLTEYDVSIQALPRHFIAHKYSLIINGVCDNCNKKNK